MSLTRDRLLEVLKYFPDTGMFIWVKPTSSSIQMGDIIDSKGSAGYIRVMIDNRRYLVHRLAFLYMGEAIPEYVDHINNIIDDNRWCNLRKATYNENNFNRVINKNSTTNVKGISFRKQYGEHGYIARVQVHGKRYNKWFSVSTYGTEELTLEAATAYVRALREELHGDYVNHG